MRRYLVVQIGEGGELRWVVKDTLVNDIEYPCTDEAEAVTLSNRLNASAEE